MKISLTGPENTFIIQNMDAMGYIFPYKEYVTKGGYEPFASFGPYMAETVINEYRQLLEEIKEKITFSFS